MLTGGILLHDFDILKTWDSADVSSGFFPPHQIGALGVTKDGRGYRFCRAGASALDPGKLAVVSTEAANHENIAVQAAAAIGAKSVTVTLGATAATANQYAGGYMVVNDVTGEGVAYLISGHPAADASANLEVTLAQGLAVALTTSSEVSLIKHPYADVVISVTDQLDMPAGVPNVTIPATDYGWLQTRGLCSVLADETLAKGEMLTIGTGVAGAVEEIDAIGEALVGVAVQAGVDTEYRAINLMID